MYTQPILRTGVELRDWMESKMRDTSNARWSADEYLESLNEVVFSWAERVKAAALYTFSDGFSYSVYEYTLPTYIRPPIIVEMRQDVWGIAVQDSEGDDTHYTWVRPPGVMIEPDGSGGQKIRLQGYPLTADARVIYYAANGPVPVTAPALSAEIDSDDTSLTVSSAVVVGDTGWVKIDAEWIQYSGVTRASASTTLLNLVRAVGGTTASTHAISQTVYWGVAVDTVSLLDQLRNQWEAELHRYYLTDGSDTEKRIHQQQITYLDQKVQQFWMTGYVTQVPVIINLGRRALGR